MLPTYIIEKYGRRGKMKHELGHFSIGTSYGGNQDWFKTFMMRIGGCGAETACDSSLYFAIHRNVENIYPFDTHNLSRKDYVDFAHVMEKYLHPRMTGINRLDIYVDGYAEYLRDRGVSRISMDTLAGSEPYDMAAETIIRQIDAGYPVPTLILNHSTAAGSGSTFAGCGIQDSKTEAASSFTRIPPIVIISARIFNTGGDRWNTGN